MQTENLKNGGGIIPCHKRLSFSGALDTWLSYWLLAVKCSFCR